MEGFLIKNGVGFTDLYVNERYRWKKSNIPTPNIHNLSNLNISSSDRNRIVNHLDLTQYYQTTAAISIAVSIDGQFSSGGHLGNLAKDHIIGGVEGDGAAITYQVPQDSNVGIAAIQPSRVDDRSCSFCRNGCFIIMEDISTCVQYDPSS